MPARTSLIAGSRLKHFRDKKLKLGVLHAGGPAPGGNQVLYAASLRARDYGLPIMAFKHGYQHLMSNPAKEVGEKWAVVIGREEIRYLRDQLSLVPGSARANPGKSIKTVSDLDNPEKTAPLLHVLEVLEQLGFGALISVGGDDTMRTGNLLQTYLQQKQKAEGKFKDFLGIVHVPKTIDKDYPGIDFTFGFMSAAEVIGERVKALHDDAKATATSVELVYHIIEIMGRAAGWLCAAASICGQATYAIVPEDYSGRRDITIETLARDCVDVILTRKNQGKNYGAITIAEGLGDILPQIDVSKDEFGHTRLEEVELAARLRRAIAIEFGHRSKTKIKLRSRTMGYDARQIKPNIFDLLLCERLGVSAVDAVVDGKCGSMVSVEGVFNPKIVPFAELIKTDDLRAPSWVMGPDEGLYQLMLAMQQPFEVGARDKTDPR